MARSYEELLADLRSGLDKKPDYSTELPERFRAPRAPKPPPEPTVEERGMFEDILARARGTFDVSQPSLFGKSYLDRQQPIVPPPPDTSLIQKETEDEIAAGAESVAARGGDPEEFISRTHELKYGKRVAQLLKAGRAHATKRLREGATPDEAERDGIDLAERHIRNLENQIAAGEQTRDAAEASAAYQGLIEGFTTRKGLARHALTTGVPMTLAGIAAGPLGWGGLATSALVAGTTTAGVAASQKFLDEQPVDWESATAEGLTNIIPVPVVGAITRGPVAGIANPLARRAAGTLALAATEAVEEPVQSVASSLVRGEGIPSGMELATEAAAGGILGGALGGAAGLIEQRRQQVSDDTAGATEIEATPPVRAAGHLGQEAADAQLKNIETALSGARAAGDLRAIEALEGARQEILDARAKGSEAPVTPGPPAPGAAVPTPPAVPPGATSSAIPPAPTPPVEAAPPPGPVSGTSIRPRTPEETAASAAGDTSVTEDAAARQAGAAPQVRTLTDQGKAEARGEGGAPPTTVRGPTSGAARGVETTPGMPPGAPASPAAPAAAPPAASASPAPAPAPPAAAPVVPARRLKIGRGAHGQVEVIFPDQNHADLFSAPGRSRRKNTGQPGIAPDWEGLSARMGLPPDLVGGAAIRYRDAVMDAIKGVEAGATFTAPTIGDVVAGQPPPAPGALTPVGPASEALGAAVGVTVPPVAPAPPKPPATIFRKGDRVTVPTGETGTVREVFPSGRIRVVYERLGDRRDDTFDADELPLEPPPAFAAGDVVTLKSGRRGVVRGPWTDPQGRGAAPETGAVFEVETEDYRGRKRVEVVSAESLTKGEPPAPVDPTPEELEEFRQESRTKALTSAAEYVRAAWAAAGADRELRTEIALDEIDRAERIGADPKRVAELRAMLPGAQPTKQEPGALPGVMTPQGQKKAEAAERREKRATELSAEEAKVAAARPGDVPWPSADSLEIAQDWYDGGKKGPALALYRAIAAAHDLGQPVDEGWRDIFPDIFDKEPAGRRQRQRTEPLAIPGVKRVYSSGMSRTGDVKAGLGWEHPIGIDINELSGPGIEQIANAVSQGWEPRIFVDSGAFSAFKKGEAQDALAIVEKYDKLLTAIVEANVNEESLDELLLVVPDVIGDQAATLESFKTVLGAMEKLPGRLFRPIFPLQTGTDRVADFFRDVFELVSESPLADRAVWGVPSNAAAAPLDQITELGEAILEYEASGAISRPAVHFLGAGSEKTLRPLVDALGAGIDVTGDSNQVRARIGKMDREGAVRTVVGAEEGAPTRVDVKPAAPRGDEPGVVVEVKVTRGVSRALGKERVYHTVEAIDAFGTVVQTDSATTLKEAEETRDIWMRQFGLLPAPVGVVKAEESWLEGLRDEIRKAYEAVIARAPEAVRKEFATQLGHARARRHAVVQAELDVDTFSVKDGFVPKIPNRGQKLKAARQNLQGARAIYESTFETMRGVLKGEPTADKIVARARQVVEGKGIRDPSAPVERPPIPRRAFEGVKGFVESHPNAPTLAEAIAKVQEYAKYHVRSAEDVLGRIARLASEVGSMGDAALRLEIDIPGLGAAKVAKALAAGPGNPSFDAIVAYRQEAEAHERAMHEMFAEFDDTEYAHPGLRSVADNIEDDAGLQGVDEDELLAMTFMAGVIDPATGEQVTFENAAAAIRAGHGRLFSRIRTAYQDAMEGVESDVPFDIPEGGASDEEITEAKRDFAYVSAIQDPFGGRYGPPPKKLTPEQLELRKKWAAKLLAAGGARARTEPVPAQRPAPEARGPEGEAAPAAERPVARGEGAPVGEGAAGSSGRGGRGSGVPAGVPGDAGQPRSAAPADAEVRGPAAPAESREGIFQIINPRERETLKRPPRYELIPADIAANLSDDQKLGVAKAIEALQAGSGFLFQDGTGVGKTREMLAVAEKFRRQGLKVLIVSKSAAISAKQDRQGNWHPTGSFADDSAAMGIPIEFTRKRATPLPAGKITLGTYHKLRDYAVDENTVLLLDEAHMLKNAGDSEVAAAGIDLIRRAKVTAFATATPGDKAYHLLYLAPIGILEGKPYDQAMKDLGLQAKPKKRVSRPKLEALKKQGVPEARALEMATEEFMVWKATSPTKHRRAVEALFNRLTENGTVIKREVDLSPVSVNTVIVPLPVEAQEVMREIEEAGFDRKLALMHMRRQQEPHKLERVKELIYQELGLGRQVVVFATRVNRSDVIQRFKDPRTGELIERLLTTSEGTLKQLAQWLEQQGISFSEIHGEAPEDSPVAQARFQSGNAKVVIATYEKGGTGINLDDRSGAAPRTMILMTAPFDSVSIVQAIGRVHRFTTKSASKIVMLYSDHGVDKWNAAVMGGKLAQLHAQVSGDINALDLGNTSADEDELLEGGAHYMDVASILAGHGKPSASTPIWNPRHYGKIIRQLQQLGVKIKMSGGDFEIKTHEGFVIVGSINKTPDQAAHSRFTWEHDEEAGDLRLVEAVKPKPRSLAKTPEVMRVLNELSYNGNQKPIVSQKQHDYLQRQLTSIGAVWGVPELPGSFQVQTQDGDFFTGVLTPPREGARLVFGKVADRSDAGSFHWQRLAGEVVLKSTDEESVETPLAGAMLKLAEGDTLSLDPAFEQVGNITGVVGTPVQAPRIPVFARPELQWGRPIRLNQGTLLQPGREVAPGVSVLGTSLREGFEKIGRIDWTGMVVNSLSDAAALFHTARNPSLEHAVLFFVDRFGIIRGTMQATSNAPNFASWGVGRLFHQRIDKMLADFAAQGIEIKGVIDLHNHPSTDPRPSKADRAHFAALKKYLGTRYMGSAIIDHERATVMTAVGKEYQIVRAAGRFMDPDPFLAEGVDSADFYRPGVGTINNDEGFRKFATSLLDQGLWKAGSTDVTVALIDPARKVRLVTLVPELVFKDRKVWGELAPRLLRLSGASAVIAATDGGFARGLETVGVDYMTDGLLQELIDLQTSDAGAGTLRGAGVPVPQWFNWKDTYGDTSKHIQLEQTLAAKEPPPSAYPAWGKDAPAWWARRVQFARARTEARARGAQANVGIDPQAFWDAFVLGVQAVRNGIRRFADWMKSLSKRPSDRPLWRRVWDYLVSIRAPVVIERRGEVRPFGQAIEGAPELRPRNLQPIRAVPNATIEDLAAATDQLFAAEGVDYGAGKPTGIGKKSDLAVNINNIEDEADIRDQIARIVRALEGRFALARQKFTGPELKQLALRLGYDETDYLRMLREKGALTAPEIIAGRVLRQHAGVDFANKSAAWRDAERHATEKDISAEERQVRREAALDAQRESEAALQKFIGIMYGTAAAGSEAGRALWAHKLMISSLTPTERFFQKLMREKRADQQQIAALADALAKGDQAAVARLIRRIYKPGFTKMLVEYFINSLLSGPPTFVANVTGNLVHEAALRAPERGLAAQLEKWGIRQGVERLLTGEASPTERVVGEAMQAIRAQVRHKFGLLAALDMGRQAITKEDLRLMSGVKGETYIPAIPGLFGKVVRTPGRVMEALDVGAKLNAMAAEKAALLWRRAYQEKGGQGIGSVAFRERLAELHHLMDQWIVLEEQRQLDPISFQKEHGSEGYTFLYKNRDLAAVYSQMKKAADVSTFRDEVTRFTSFVKQMRGAYPWLTFIVPFVHTTERILVQGFRRTPLGLLKAAYNIQQGRIEGGEASDRLAQGILGSLMTGAIYMLADDGLITGGGPDDPEEREQWLKTGKLPYAIKIGDTWVSYARIEPFATIFGLAADLSEAKDEKTAGDAFGKLHYAVLNNVTNKTYLEGIVSAAEAVGNPDRYLARYWKRSVGALVPNLLATAARSIDPTIRETDTISQTLMSRVPILSEELPARLTGTGEPVERGETAISRFVSPVRYSEEAGPERNLERLFLETGYSPTQPPRSLTLPGTMGRKVELTRAEREIYADYARRASAFARTLAARGDWTKLDAYGKEEVLKRIFRFAHDAARREMLASAMGRLRRREAEVMAR